MQKNDTLIFREAKGKEELTALLKLRYQVYRSSPLKGFCPKNEHGIDMDSYDLYSRHFGLFLRESGKDNPIGYLRLIEKNLTSFAPTILSIALEQSTDFGTKLFEEKSLHKFPSANYFSEVLSLSQKKLYKGIEVGRFAIVKEFQSKKLASEIVLKSIAALCLCYFKHDYAVIMVAPKHAPLYQFLGFELLSNYEVKIHGLPFVSLKIVPHNFPNEVFSYFKSIADKYKEKGEIFYSNQKFK